MTAETVPLLYIEALKINCRFNQHPKCRVHCSNKNDILGISDLNEDKSLESIVRPQTHKIKDDADLCYEDPVSCHE